MARLSIAGFLVINVRQLSMNPKQILKATTLLAAAASLAMSIFLYFSAGDEVLNRLNGIYVGVWVPSILSLGTFLLAGSKDK